MRVRTDYIWLSVGLISCFNEHRNEPSGSIKGSDFLEHLTS
jgi:hypothetical protein